MINALLAVATLQRAVVARIDGVPIYYDAIRCDAELLRVRNRLPASQDAADKECGRVEQQELDEQIVPALYEAASRELHVPVSNEEVLSRMTAAHLDDAAIRRMADEAAVLPRALIAVYEGGDVHEVWRTRLASGNAGAISEEAFIHIVRGVAGRPSADRMLADSSFERTKEMLIAAEHRLLVTEHVDRAISEEATRRHISERMFRDEFWEKLISRSGVEIVDARFHMPALGRNQ